MVSQKAPSSVTPAKVGVQNFLELLDSGFRREDGFFWSHTFYEIIIIELTHIRVPLLFARHARRS
jgi:hypothetical protein